MKTLINALFALLWAFGMEATEARVLTIVIDLSSSSPYLSAPKFSDLAAAAAAKRVEQMALGDMIRVKTFGDVGGNNLGQFEVRIDRRHRAAQVADAIRALLAGLPKTLISPQSSTHLIALLEFQNFACAEQSQILIFTDGIESSESLDAKHFIRGASLPAAEVNVLKGCQVTMIGLGQAAEGSLSPSQIKHIRSAWTTWMQQSGADFEARIEP